MRKDGISIFVIGCIAITLALVFAFNSYFKTKPNDRVGAPPEHRGFVLDLTGQPADAYAADFSAMRQLHATAVLLVANPSDPTLLPVIEKARAADLLPWLALPPAPSQDAYKAAALTAARFCTTHRVEYLIVGMRLRDQADEGDYWKQLLSSIRREAPYTQIIFACDYMDYMFMDVWSESEFLAATGDFPVHFEQTGDTDRATWLVQRSWGDSINDLVSFSHRENPTGRPRGAAIVDAVVPKNLSKPLAEAYVRGLLNRSKRQAPPPGETAIMSRDPLAALFVGGWKLQDSGGIRAYAPIFEFEWSNQSITYTLPPETAPATTTSSSSTSTTK